MEDSRGILARQLTPSVSSMNGPGAYMWQRPRVAAGVCVDTRGALCGAAAVCAVLFSLRGGGRWRRDGAPLPSAGAPLPLNASSCAAASGSPTPCDSCALQSTRCAVNSSSLRVAWRWSCRPRRLLGWPSAGAWLPPRVPSRRRRRARQKRRSSVPCS